MRVDIAVTAKMSHRRAPFACVGSIARNIGWNTGPWEEPDLDGFIGPLGCIDTTTDSVKAGTEGVAVFGDDTTTCILLLTAGVDIAVGSVEGALRRGVI